jgi:hypothetical protein
MGEITYQGRAPFRLVPAQPTTARVVGEAVEMTVFGSVEGAHPAEFPIQVPMSFADARELAAQLTESVILAEARQRKR